MAGADFHGAALSFGWQPRFGRVTGAGLTLIVMLIEAVLVMLIAFFPALAAAFGLYSVIRRETLLPVTMTATQLIGVFAITLFMSVISALLSLGRLRRADPAEIF